MIAVGSCSAILLSKASIFERFLSEYDVCMSESVFEEVMEGKKKLLSDALLIERLHKEGKVRVSKADDRMTKVIAKGFNMGDGEASTLALALEHKGLIVATDNRQGRKAAEIHDVPMVGSVEILVRLFEKGKIDREKAVGAMRILKEQGWFEQYLIEEAMGRLR